MSKGNILKRTLSLRDQDLENSSMFRKMNPVVGKIEAIGREWNYKQEELRVMNISKKEEQAIKIESRKIRNSE